MKYLLNQYIMHKLIDEIKIIASEIRQRTSTWEVVVVESRVGNIPISGSGFKFLFSNTNELVNTQNIIFRN